MDEEDDRMQAELDELDEHIDDAAKKAQKTRRQADPDADEAVADIVGNWSETESSDDDPSGAFDEASEKDS